MRKCRQIGLIAVFFVCRPKDDAELTITFRALYPKDKTGPYYEDIAVRRLECHHTISHKTCKLDC